MDFLIIKKIGEGPVNRNDGNRYFHPSTGKLIHSHKNHWQFQIQEMKAA